MEKAPFLSTSGEYAVDADREKTEEAHSEASVLISAKSDIPVIWSEFNAPTSNPDYLHDHTSPVLAG